MVSLKEFDFGRILALKEQGFSQQKISEMLTIPKTTVGDFLRRYKERGCFQRKSGSGRPSLLKSEHKTIFNDILIKKPKISAIKMVEELREKTGVSISSETIRRKLKKDGFIACSSLKRPLLSKKIRSLVLRSVQDGLTSQIGSGTMLFFQMNANLLFLTLIILLKFGENPAKYLILVILRSH
jgi:transposase